MNVDIEIGSVFMWTDSRPAVSIKLDPPDMPATVHDAYIVSVDRPSRWWHLRAWLHVARELWRMPR